MDLKPNDQDQEGLKVRKANWQPDSYAIVRYVGQETFIGDLYRNNLFLPGTTFSLVDPRGNLEHDWEILD